jgi:phage regulator Rha-like protein
MNISVRQQIVDAVKKRMKTVKKLNGYQTNMGLNVFVWRTTNIPSIELPCIIIKDSSEVSEAVGSRHIHILPLSIEIKIESVDMEVIRGAIADISMAIGVDPTWGKLVVQTVPVNVEATDFAIANKAYSSTAINIELKYRTKPFSPFRVA